MRGSKEQSFLKYTAAAINEQTKNQRYADTLEPWTIGLDLKNSLGQSERSLRRMPLIKRPPARNSLDKYQQLRKSESYKKEGRSMDTQYLGDQLETHRRKKSPYNITSVMLIQIPEMEAVCVNNNPNLKGRSLHRIKYKKTSNNCLKPREEIATSLLLSLRAIKKRIGRQIEQEVERDTIGRRDSQRSQANPKLAYESRRRNKVIGLGLRKLALLNKT